MKHTPHTNEGSRIREILPSKASTGSPVTCCNILECLPSSSSISSPFWSSLLPLASLPSSSSSDATFSSYTKEHKQEQYRHSKRKCNLYMRLLRYSGMQEQDCGMMQLISAAIWYTTMMKTILCKQVFSIIISDHIRKR